MSNKIFKFGKFVTELVEAFDFKNIAPVKLKRVNLDKYESADKTVKVNFERFDAHDIKQMNLPSYLINAKEIYNVGYTIDDSDSQSYQTDYKEFISILAGVKEAILDFIVRNKPDLLIFISLDRSGDMKNDPTKDRLYKYAVIKNIPPNYVAETDVKIFGVLDFTGIIMYKKESKEIKFEKRYTH